MKLRPTLASLVAVLAITAAAGFRPEPARDTITQVELGRLLFWDPILSGPRDISCATCHHPDLAYADGRALSLGTGSVGLGSSRVDRSGGTIPVVKRNSPTILNVAFNGLEEGRRGGRAQGVLNRLVVDSVRAPMFWDRRVRSLELQALEPLKALEEMRGNTYPERVAVDSVIARLRAIPEYVTLFREAFGANTRIDASQYGRAMAAFERSLVAINSPFDRFRAGDVTALTPQQIRGLNAFDDAGCENCHDGPMFTEFDLEAEGVAENPLLAAPDTGAGRFRFRTPTLRNIALTAPYMHNGMLPTLEEVLRFYDEGRSRNPNVLDRRPPGSDNDDPVVRRLPVLSGQFRGVDDMSDQEMADIVAFLRALSDENFDRTIPTRVPSGLPVGGAIGTR
jgi:cytochrome c peroxidase